MKRIDGMPEDAFVALFFAAFFTGIAIWLFSVINGGDELTQLLIKLIASAFLGLVVWLLGCFVAFLNEKEAPSTSDPKTKEHPS